MSDGIIQTHGDQMCIYIMQSNGGCNVMKFSNFSIELCVLWHYILHRHHYMATAKGTCMCTFHSATSAA